jgi:HTH-type transcriptional regulator/antitoxin MqsA
MIATRYHPDTGTLLTRQIRSQPLHIGIYTETVDLPGWYPEGEGDSLHSGADYAAYEARSAVLRKRYGARIRRIRKNLGLTRAEAGMLLGNGAKAFADYEAGHCEPESAMVGLLEILHQDPTLLGVLRALRDPTPPVAEPSPQE